MRILIPLPRYGFDPTEAGVPWTFLRAAGHDTTFATPDGQPAQADRRMVTGEGLGVLSRTLRADANGRRAYEEMAASEAFTHPVSYEAIGECFDALLLPGGHDKGMREYLDSPILQATIAAFFQADRPVAAICHGTLLVARSLRPDTGKSVLFGRRTTGLTRGQELTAFWLTRSWLGDYYRTYPEKDVPGRRVTMEDDLRTHLARPEDFVRGPGWPIPSGRDTPTNLSAGFSVRDGNYLSARWPGDAHRFATDLVALLK